MVLSPSETEFRTAMNRRSEDYAISHPVCRGSKKLPPGPRPVPIFGNLFQLGDNAHKSLAEFAKIYGPIMSVKLGNVVTVIASSDAVAREVLRKHDSILSNRFVPDSMRVHHHNELGLGWMPISPLWRNHRKVTNLHIFASKKLNGNQYLRHKKIEQLLSAVQESCRLGEAVDIGQAVFNTILSMISTSIFSMDLADLDSKMKHEFKKTIIGITVESEIPNFADFFPLLRKFDLQGVRRRMSIHGKMLLELFNKLYEERVEVRKVKGSASTGDVLDTMVDIIENKTEELNKLDMLHLFVELFVAGSDTTTITLVWAMAQLLRNPKVLLKAQAEIAEAIGKGKQVEESDTPPLPYLEAVIKETLRMYPATPLLIPRRAGADIEINGFTVPKGAQVLVNAWAIGRDPSIWEMPECFMPERFLGSNIDFKGGNCELIPFGGGRRICPGWPLAMRVLHSMLGSLINCFDWKLEEGVTPENMDMGERFGISLHKARPLRAIPVALP